MALRPLVTVTAHRYTYSGAGDTGDAVLDSANVVIESTITLPGGVAVTKRASGDVWSYPNIHGDIQATANAAGVKQGVTFTYDSYGNALAGIVDNLAGEIDNGNAPRTPTRPGADHRDGSPRLQPGTRTFPRS